VCVCHVNVLRAIDVCLPCKRCVHVCVLLMCECHVNVRVCVCAVLTREPYKRCVCACCSCVRAVQTL